MQRRYNENITLLLLRCPLDLRWTRSGEDQERGCKGARACSSVFLKGFSCLQQLLLAAALACRRVCLCSSACLQQALQQAAHYLHAVAVVRDMQQQLHQHISAAAAGSRGVQQQQQFFSQTLAGSRHGRRPLSRQAWPIQSVRRIFGKQNASVESQHHANMASV